MTEAVQTDTALVTGVDFVAVPALDIDESAEFYGTTLGLLLVKRWGEMPVVPEPWSEVQ